MGKIIAIAALAANNIIGDSVKNDLPWPKIKSDMRFFEKTTTGTFLENGRKNFLIMGRKSYESLPEKIRPLKNRSTVVVTRNNFYLIKEGLYSATSVEDAIVLCNHIDSSADIFIAGGGQIYEYVLQHDLVDEMIITHLLYECEGDVVFPHINTSVWYNAEKQSPATDENSGIVYAIVTYRKS